MGMFSHLRRSLFMAVYDLSSSGCEVEVYSFFYSSANCNLRVSMQLIILKSFQKMFEYRFLFACRRDSFSLK